MIKTGKELAEYLKGKRVVIVAGEMCNKIAFDDKSLLDYAVEISNKLNAPVAAAGNTVKPLREKGVEQTRKMWAMELAFYMREPWEADKEHPVISDEKPEVLLFIGYTAPVIKALTSTIRSGDGDTVALTSFPVETATYSFPEATSLKQWEQNLKDLVSALKN